MIRDHWEDFGELIRRIGGAQVARRGTIGGNIANGSPIGDTMPALIALAARSCCSGDAATGTCPGRLLPRLPQNRARTRRVRREIQIPLSAADAVFKCYKISKRLDQDISAVIGAFSLALSPDNCRKNPHRLRRHGRRAEAGGADRTDVVRPAVDGKDDPSGASGAGGGALAALGHARVSGLSADGRAEFIPVTNVRDVLKQALVRQPEPVEWDEAAEEAAAAARALNAGNPAASLAH